jgi:hypothetical protein
MDIPGSVLEKITGSGDPNSKAPRLMNAINQFRAKICFQMKDEHGENFNSFTACKEFMEEACRPGGDLRMDGDGDEVTSGKGYCKEYFPKTEEDVEKIVEEMDKETEAARKEQKAEKEAATKEKSGKQETLAKDVDAGQKGEAGKGKVVHPSGGAAPAPAPSPAPGPAGAPGPGTYPKDEAWYYKNGGTDPTRFHMSEKRKLPVHGYHGKLVEHDDMKTSSTDWHSEFGDSADISAVCKDHPDNPWCVEQGYHGSASRHDARNSATSAMASSAMFVLFMVTVCAAFF